MANKLTFQSSRGHLPPVADTVNRAGGKAYQMAPKNALAQFVATGCFNNTFYATAEDQVKEVLALLNLVNDSTFVAKAACYGRGTHMKDMPALLTAWLSSHDAKLHERTFYRVMDSVKMLRNYVQIIRSGVVGRKSLGTAPKRLILEWLASRGEDVLFKHGIGQDPSLADVIKMVHPKPTTSRREAFYGYLLGKKHNFEALPGLVTQYEQFKAGASTTVPDLPFMMLSSLPLKDSDWVSIARTASWQTTRMNLNTFLRHNVFLHADMTEIIAERLASAKEISKSRVFPYQLLAAYVNCEPTVPVKVRNALQDAMELATANVPAIEGTVVICPDVSGSMSSAITGQRKGSTSKVRCIDVAGLFAASILRKNQESLVLPFEGHVVSVKLNGRDSVMTNAQLLGSIGGGSTNCAAPIERLNANRTHADLVVFISDNQSWVNNEGWRSSESTNLMSAWERFKVKNPKARLVCIDLQPYANTQAIERDDILNVGGFSDQVFELVATFAKGELNPAHWVGEIEKIEL